MTAADFYPLAVVGFVIFGYVLGRLHVALIQEAARQAARKAADDEAFRKEVEQFIRDQAALTIALRRADECRHRRESSS